MSQRFCLRWNNHQSNMLSVFDQLLHDESFVDVTLAVDGHLLKAHKMVLSACSPLFQALFIGHPDKHPIVILKDVPYADMRCLLDFMYRGEVSVDQDRLTAFLKVAESLRIKGLTEVNEEKCDIPSITNNLLSSLPNAQTPPPPPPPPPHLQRLPHGNSSVQKRSVPPLVASNPLLGSALTAPKRKRGRPRKLSGSSNGDASHTRDSSPHDHDQDDALDLEFDSRLGHGSSGESIHSSPPPPELMEMHMDYGQPSAVVKLSKSVNRDNISRIQEGLKDSKGTSRKKVKEENEPTPGTSSQDLGSQQFRISGSNSLSNSLSSPSGNGNLQNSPGSGGSSLLNADSYSSGLGESHLDSVAITPTLAPPFPPPLIAAKKDTFDWEDEKYADLITNSPLREEQRKIHEDSLPPVLKLTKKEIFDKRKTARPRKLTDRPTINNEADFNAAAAAAASAVGTEASEQLKYESFDLVTERQLASTPTSDVEHRDGNGNSIFQEPKSVREFCSREEGNLFRCKVCQRTYTHISNFCRHYITSHRGVKQEIPCLICKKMFTRKDNMVTHMKMVHGANRTDRPPIVAPNS